jgi:hypothetical protein
MKNLVLLTNKQDLILKKIDHLQQAILQTPSETTSPSKALALAYQMLPDEQKIAFILAGGAPSLSRYQQSTQTGPDTGQLPVLCY